LKISKPKLIVCESCGKERPHQAFGLCNLCYAKRYYRKHRVLKERKERFCACCGKVFMPRKFSSNQKFCSHSCSERGDLTKICRWCHKEYKVTKRRFEISKCCSRSCLAKYEQSKKTKEERSEIASKRAYNRWAKYTPEERSQMNTGENNPRYGCVVTEETRRKISEGNMGNIPWDKGLTKYTDPRLKAAGKKVAGSGNGMFGKVPSSRCNLNHGGFRDDLGHNVRSTWEANVARIFNYLGIEYEYEGETFRLGETCYTPDFKLGAKQFCEVKGFMRPKSKMKIEKFIELFPEYSLFLIDKDVYEFLEIEFSQKVSMWEFPKRIEEKEDRTKDQFLLEFANN